MKKSIVGVLLVLALSQLFSCVVSKKKYDALSRDKSALEVANKECDDSLTASEQNRNALQQELASLNALIDSLKKDTAAIGAELRTMESNCQALEGAYKRLMETHNKLQTANVAKLEALNKDLARREVEMGKLKTDLDNRERRVKELERVLEEKERASKALEQKLNNALLAWKDKGLEVEIRNGNVYVSISDQLLFKSGSTTPNANGIEALKQLAGVLMTQKDITIMVEGHTDDVPVAKGTACMEDNWDLSVLRATNITRLLIGSGVDAKHIIASGKASFSPKVEGKTPEARAKNRRTEIILIPQLEELYQLLGQ